MVSGPRLKRKDRARWKGKALRLNPNHTHKPIPCPSCGEKLNAAMSVRENGKPDGGVYPGLHTICCCCGQILEYGPNLDSFLKRTLEEIEHEYTEDSMVFEALRHTQQFILAGNGAPRSDSADANVPPYVADVIYTQPTKLN